MKKLKILLEDYIKACKKANRELDLLHGFTAKHKVHKSIKTYTRKVKHKNKYC
jgi:hypothetical protein